MSGISRPVCSLCSRWCSQDPHSLSAPSVPAAMSRSSWPVPPISPVLGNVLTASSSVQSQVLDCVRVQMAGATQASCLRQALPSPTIAATWRWSESAEKKPESGGCFLLSPSCLSRCSPGTTHPVCGHEYSQASMCTRICSAHLCMKVCNKHT